MKKSTKIIFMLIMGTMFSISGFPQSTYYWKGKTSSNADSSDWQIANNWDPQRTTPAANDILIFDDTYTGFVKYYVTNIPDENIDQLKFLNGNFFFKAAVDSARLTISSLLQIDRTSGADLIGGPDTIPVNLSLGASSIGNINGTIIAWNIVLFDESLTTIGANYSDLTRSARFVKLLAGAWLTLETSTALATKLIVYENIRLESNKSKFASILMIGTPEPEITGQGIHTYFRELFLSGRDVTQNTSSNQASGTTTKPQRGVTIKCCDPKKPDKTKRKLVIDWDKDVAFSGTIKCSDGSTIFFPRQNDPKKTDEKGHAEIILSVPCPDPVTVNFVAPDPPPIKENTPVPSCDSKNRNFTSSCEIFAFDETKYEYISNWDLYGELEYQPNRGKFINYSNNDTYTDFGRFHNGYLSTGSDAAEYQITGSYIQPWNLFNGWNLMGNPYPSAINWGTDNEPVEGWTRTGIYNSFYIWNMELGQYAYFNGSGDGDSLNGGTRYIAPCQGFWIRADSIVNNYQLSTDNRVRCHSTTPFLKKNYHYPINSLKVSVTGNGSSDELLVKFDPRATLGIDAFDTYKFFGDKYAPQIYTVAENHKKMSINTYPEIHKSIDIPMNFSIDTNGQFTLKFNQINSFSENVEVFFEDLKTEKLIKLQDSYEYIFSYRKEEDANRFVLHFSNKTFGIDDKDNDANIQIYSSNNMVYIRNFTENSGRVIIYDLLGKEVIRRKLENQTIDNFKLEAPAGCYIVKLISGNKAYNRKVCFY
jgi:hypothetical protein